MILHKVLIFFSILFIFSCKTEKKTDNSVMNLKISAFTESQQFPDASISSMQYTDGNFVFGLSNYTLGLQTPDAQQKMCANSSQGQMGIIIYWLFFQDPIMKALKTKLLLL